MTLAELLANATPGPWRLSFGRFPKQVREDEAAFATVSGPPSLTDETPGSEVIRQPVHLGDSRSKPDHWEADARLIALAPELAQLALDMGEALRKLRQWDAMDMQADGRYWREDVIDPLLALLDGIANDGSST